MVVQYVEHVVANTFYWWNSQTCIWPSVLNFHVAVCTWIRHLIGCTFKGGKQSSVLLKFRSATLHQTRLRYKIQRLCWCWNRVVVFEGKCNNMFNISFNLFTSAVYFMHIVSDDNLFCKCMMQLIFVRYLSSLLIINLVKNGFP